VPVLLADRSRRITPIYVGRVVWHGQEIIVQIQEADGDPLVGMLLMLGSKLTVHVRNGGPVEIEPEP
jgi:predicted aspartyl protease